MSVVLDKTLLPMPEDIVVSLVFPWTTWDYLLPLLSSYFAWITFYLYDDTLPCFALMISVNAAGLGLWAIGRHYRMPPMESLGRGWSHWYTFYWVITAFAYIFQETLPRA